MQDEEVGLCFALGNGDNQRYLVPEAMPASAPFYGNWPADCLRFRYDFLPRSLVPRFIVEAHDLLADPPTRWRTGAVFTVQDRPILVETNTERREINIAVDGPASRRRTAPASSSTARTASANPTPNTAPKPVELLRYVEHWEKEKKIDLDEARNRVGNQHLEGIRESIDLYVKIRNTILKLMDILDDMLSLHVEEGRDTDFAAFFKAIERQLSR